MSNWYLNYWLRKIRDFIGSIEFRSQLECMLPLSRFLSCNHVNEVNSSSVVLLLCTPLCSILPISICSVAKRTMLPTAFESLAVQREETQLPLVWPDKSARWIFLTCDKTVVQLIGLKYQQFGRRRRRWRCCISIAAIRYSMANALMILLLWHLWLVMLLQHMARFDWYRWQNHVWWFQYWSAVTWWRSFRWHTENDKRKSVRKMLHPDPQLLQSTFFLRLNGLRFKV